jgi:hypothetical protein
LQLFKSQKFKVVLPRAIKFLPFLDNFSSSRVDYKKT